MKKSNIIDLALKLFGIYIIIMVILQSTSLYHFQLLFPVSNSASVSYATVGLFFGATIIVLLFSCFLLFKSSKIAKKICKEDTEFDFTMDPNYSKILEISLLIFALYILIFRFPNLISGILQIFGHLTRDFPQEKASIVYSICYLIQYLFGYLLLTNAKAITAWIIRINQKNITEA